MFRSGIAMMVLAPAVVLLGFAVGGVVGFAAIIVLAVVIVPYLGFLGVVRHWAAVAVDL